MDMSGSAPTAAIGRSDVELAADGDEVAFGRLVSLHYDDMARVAFVITGDRSLAQDAVQSAWVRAWSRLGSVRDPGRVRGWLLTIAANEARQIARRNRRAAVVELDVDLEGPSRLDPGVAIGRIDLARALASLSPDDRALLALRYVAGVDAGELGAMTGRTASGTRARLSRLTARLREELGDDD
jgi:RNA polymerase sigma-70 factor (ECF subfamily)